MKEYKIITNLDFVLDRALEEGHNRILIEDLGGTIYINTWKQGEVLEGLDYKMPESSKYPGWPRFLAGMFRAGFYLNYPDLIRSNTTSMLFEGVN